MRTRTGIAVAALGAVLVACGPSNTAASPSSTKTATGAPATASTSTEHQTVNVLTPSDTTEPTTTPLPTTTTTAPAPSDPSAVVQAYFQAINNRDYQRAWDLGGHNLGSSYTKFASGFANTDHDDLTILNATDQTVTVRFVATNTDGSQQQFQGTYTAANGVITAAKLSPVGAAPPVQPSTPPAQQVDLCGAPQNPYGYNYCGRGANVTSPPSDVCTYFRCIANFPNGRGYMEECSDGTVSKSGGVRGSCSTHGGDLRAVTG